MFHPEQTPECYRPIHCFRVTWAPSPWHDLSSRYGKILSTRRQLKWWSDRTPATDFDAGLGFGFCEHRTDFRVPRRAGNSLTIRAILSASQVGRYLLELVLIYPIYSTNLRLRTSRAWSPEKRCRKPEDYGQLTVNHVKSGIERQATHNKHITSAKRNGPW